MSSEEKKTLIIEEKENGVVLISLNRPKALNATNAEVRAELAEAFTLYNNPERARCIVLTGSGEKAFCAGTDLNEFADATPKDMFAMDINHFCDCFNACMTPVIAAVNGYALGGGFEIAMMSDIIIASEKAKFGLPEVTLGIMPGHGGTQRIFRAAGKSMAMQMILTGEFITAQRAFETGIVSMVVPPEELLGKALDMAAKIASMPAHSVRRIKQLVLDSMSMPLESGLRMEKHSFELLFDYEDKTERINAFLKK